MLNLEKKIQIINFKKKLPKKEFWQNLAIGDELVISHELDYLSRYAGRLETPKYSLKNVRTGEEYTNTVNLFLRTFEDCLAWQECI